MTEADQFKPGDLVVCGMQGWPVGEVMYVKQGLVYVDTNLGIVPFSPDELSFTYLPF